MGAPFEPDLLSAVPATCVRLVLTTRCNLRCVYCAVSDPDFHGEHAEADILAKVVEQLPEVRDDELVVLVNGAGETTYMPGWQRACAQLMDRGLTLGITTNLAKRYSRDELLTLARCETLVVSLDSFDDALTRRMRRKVGVATIVDNLARVRAAAARVGIHPPRVQLSCGLYAESIPTLVDFARRAVALAVDGVVFWNLDEHVGLPTAGMATPLDQVVPERLGPMLDAIDEAIGILQAAGVAVEVAGEFLGPLRATLEPVHA